MKEHFCMPAIAQGANAIYIRIGFCPDIVKFTEWATGLEADATALDEAIAQDNPAKSRRYFWRFRRRAGDRFFRVDTALKELCGDLREIGEPLASVMDMIG